MKEPFRETNESRDYASFVSVQLSFLSLITRKDGWIGTIKTWLINILIYMLQIRLSNTIHVKT